jgi:hypothetical protein
MVDARLVAAFVMLGGREWLVRSPNVQIVAAGMGNVCSPPLISRQAAHVRKAGPATTALFQLLLLQFQHFVSMTAQAMGNASMENAFATAVSLE